jgi:hypothetical protein
MSGRTRVGLGVLGAAGAAAVAAALVTGGAPTAQQSPSPVSPAAATASASSAPAPAAAPHGDEDLADLRARFQESVPAELRADLVELRDVPAAQRLAELERIRDAALAGEYGVEAKAGAERLTTMIAMLPPELSADLEGLATTEEAGIPDAVERIRDRALAGEYGPQVQGYAEQFVATAGQHGYDVTGDLDRYASAD